MAHTVTAILSHQPALAARARLSTGDVNEAYFLVGRVMTRAFGRYGDHAVDDIPHKLDDDLEREIRQRAM